MAEQNKIMINETEYNFDDLDEQSQYFVNQVRNLKGRIAEARFNLDQLVAAENSFTNALIASVKTPEVEATESE